MAGNVSTPLARRSQRRHHQPMCVPLHDVLFLNVLTLDTDYDYCLEKHKLHKAEPEQNQRGKYPEPSPTVNQKGILPFGTADITNLMSPPDIQIRRDSSFHDSDYQSLVEECTIDPSLLTTLV